MKKMFRLVATWLKSMFAKKQTMTDCNENNSDANLEMPYATCTPHVVSVRTCEYPFQNNNQNPKSCSSPGLSFVEKKLDMNKNILADTSEETIEDKKQILRDYNKEKIGNDYDLVLSHTVRSEKPNKYSTNKHIVHVGGDKKFKLTSKQDFFLTEIRILQEKNQDANISDVVQAFLNLKYSKSLMSPTSDELKPSYHKKTINYLVKCGAIKIVSKNRYRTNF